MAFNFNVYNTRNDRKIIDDFLKKNIKIQKYENLEEI